MSSLCGPAGRRRRIPTAEVSENLYYIPGPLPLVAERAAAEKKHGRSIVEWAFAYPDPARDAFLDADDASRAIAIARDANSPHPRAEHVFRMLRPGHRIPTDG